MENPVIIFGAGLIGQIALEIFKSNDVVVYGFLDDNDALHGTEINDTPIYSFLDDEGYTRLIGKKTEAFVALSSLVERKHVVEMLKNERESVPTNAIHKLAILAQDINLGHGNLIDLGAVISTGVKMGHHNYIYAGAVVDATAKIGNFVTIGPGARIGADVTIADGAFIGTGAVIINGITIGENASIGAGSVVVAPVGANTKVFGNPAQKV